MVIDSEAPPSSASWGWCAAAALCQFWAAVLAVSVWATPDFATDFENGTRIANAGSSATLSAVLSIVGIFCALAAIFRPRASALAAGAGAVLLLTGCATGLSALPLIGHYG
ncbi:hypothetical protein BVC93_18350 [Mycobacterium sp. MS1601]|uniref:hypothetical protein n=1 Tax=Mycobacterium sp. MS1601 TaxID=1936029 RepID=UPI0009798073|nr:hypothetical protein [Mycobacterium sp. MS1601]AQA04064.1 hypothetical protein BVC93_18350 [Mycobacterium sp. MS1601]